MCGGAHLPVHARGNRRIPFKSLSSFCQLNHRTWTRVSRFGDKHKYLLSHLAHPCCWRLYTNATAGLLPGPKGGSLSLRSLFFISYPLPWLSFFFCICLRRESYWLQIALVLLAGLFSVDRWITDQSSSAGSMTILISYPVKFSVVLEDLESIASVSISDSLMLRTSNVF